MDINDTNFVFLGNNLAIDFVNTQIIQRGELVELLEENADVMRWAQQAGYAITGKCQSEELETVRKMRAALRELFQAAIEERLPPQQALTTVNRHLAENGTHQILQLNTSSGALTLEPNLKAIDLFALLAKLAYEGAQLLTAPAVSNIKSCSNPNCLLVFLDTSRTRKRRWCSMDICGNRAKAAKHYRKQK